MVELDRQRLADDLRLEVPAVREQRPQRAGRSSAPSASPSRRRAPLGGRRIRGSSRPRSDAPRRPPSRAGSRRRAGCRPWRCASTIVSPERTTTAPLAWRASLPVSKEISCPPTSARDAAHVKHAHVCLFPSAARMAASIAQNFSFSLRARCYRASERHGRHSATRVPSAKTAGVPVTAARIPPSKSRRTRSASDRSERRSRSKCSRSSPSPRARSHRCGSSTLPWSA